MRSQGDGGLVVNISAQHAEGAGSSPDHERRGIMHDVEVCRRNLLQGENARISKESGDEEHGPPITFYSASKEHARGGC